MEEKEHDIAGVITGVGPRLRRIRDERGATLAELSASTGISTSTLSRLESGQRKPTLELLLALARAYDVPIDELVDAPPVGDPRVRMKAVQRNGMTFLPLSRRPGGVQAFKLVIPGLKKATRRTDAPPEQQSHEGYEWLYVLDGRLRLLLGDRDLELGPGEAAEFDTHVPHAILNATVTPVEVLALFGRQGERAHLRIKAG